MATRKKIALFSDWSRNLLKEKIAGELPQGPLGVKFYRGVVYMHIIVGQVLDFTSSKLYTFPPLIVQIVVLFTSE